MSRPFGVSGEQAKMSESLGNSRERLKRLEICHIGPINCPKTPGSWTEG